MAIAKIINVLLEKSCKYLYVDKPGGRRQFWTFEEIRQEELGFWYNSKRNVRQMFSVKFVLDTLLGPIYNGETDEWGGATMQARINFTDLQASPTHLHHLSKWRDS